jgi:putative FmdB family regulatory protein
VEVELPIYEFECLDCGLEFEKLVRKSGSEPEVACPECGGRNVEQQVSAFAARMTSGKGGPPGSCAPGGG